LGGIREKEDSFSDSGEEKMGLARRDKGGHNLLSLLGEGERLVNVSGKGGGGPSPQKKPKKNKRKKPGVGVLSQRAREKKGGERK